MPVSKFRLLLFCLLIVNTQVSFPQAMRTHTVITQIEEMIREWEHSREVNLDPRATRLIAAEAGKFMGTFGIDYRSPDRRITEEIFYFVDRGEEFKNLLFQYLDDATVVHVIDRLYERMAKYFGYSAQDAGFPSVEPNSYKLIDVGEYQLSDSYTVLSDGKPDETSLYTKLLLLPGDHLLLSSSQTLEIIVPSVTDRRYVKRKK